MITKLTKAQEAAVLEYKNRWLAYGTMVKPANRKVAEAGISELYKIAGHKSPGFQWVASPLEARNKFKCSSPYFLGQMDAYWIAFYLYCRDELGIKYEDKYSKALDTYADIAKSCGWWFPYSKIAVVCERPVECHLKNGVLHNDGGMAIKYSDGFGSWNLNGVRVPKELVMTPAEKLDPAILLKEKNAEIRREIVRKIGIERVCKKLAVKTLDSSGDYQLLLLDIGDGNVRPYLKMKNPSIDVWHIEGVAPNIKTVNEALAWRNGVSNSPEVLT